MAQEKIKIIINPTTMTVTLDMDGFKGSKCQEVSQGFEKLLGEVKVRTKKPAAFAQEQPELLVQRLNQ
jgi:hypothetical protein